MNIERLKRLRASLEEDRNFFDMTCWPSGQALCNTACCIGGHGQLLMVNDGMNPRNGGLFWPEEVGQWLGLEKDTWAKLFYIMRPDEIRYDDDAQMRYDLWKLTTVDDAIRVLDTLIETGVVDWSHVIDRYNHMNAIVPEGDSNEAL